MSLARSGSSAFPRHPIRRKIRFQLVCSVLRASPAALRGHNGVLDSVGICRGRRSSAVRSVVLLAHCRPASPSEWPGLCARQSESRTRFRGHPSRLKPYGRTRIRWYEHLNSLTRAHNHPWQTRQQRICRLRYVPHPLTIVLARFSLLVAGRGGTQRTDASRAVDTDRAQTHLRGLLGWQVAPARVRAAVDAAAGRAGCLPPMAYRPLSV